MSRSMTRSLLLVAAAVLLASGCERPPIDAVQRGYRGTGMDQMYNPRTVASKLGDNAVPESLPAADAGGPPAGTVYQNLQVLGDLNVAQLARVMVAITSWVAPADQSCNYCHAATDMASDANYRKVVSRQMLRMVRDINSHWQTHVAGTGVTCYTCHRGNGVPKYVWYGDPGQEHFSEFAGNRAGQNAAAASVGLASLPNDPFGTYMAGKPESVRVVATDPLRGSDTGSNIKQTEKTYGLMIHISEALGVNCTYCHNTRSFASWDGSTPQRATAWYGIRMVRELNSRYLEPLTKTFPADRKGPLGDVAKVNCLTCHQGVYKPLYGTSMVHDYPELAGPMPVAEAPAAAPPAAVPPVAAQAPAAH